MSPSSAPPAAAAAAFPAHAATHAWPCRLLTRMGRPPDTAAGWGGAGFPPPGAASPGMPGMPGAQPGMQPGWNAPAGAWAGGGSAPGPAGGGGGWGGGSGGREGVTGEAEAGQSRGGQGGHGGQSGRFSGQGQRQPDPFKSAQERRTQKLLSLARCRSSGINFDAYEDIPVETSGDNCPPRGRNARPKRISPEAVMANVRRCGVPEAHSCSAACRCPSPSQAESLMAVRSDWVRENCSLLSFLSFRPGSYGPPP